MLHSATTHLSGADPVLAGVIQRVGHCRLRVNRSREPFDALVRAVTFQQLNGTAAETIYRRFLALFPKGAPAPQQILDMPVEKLRGAGLSGAKTAAIRDIAAKARDKVVPTRREALRLSDTELIERLTAIRGVGPWTVEMLMIFTLGRRDVLPVSDYGVRKGFALVYGCKGLPRPAEMLNQAECWRPYRSIASWYLWRILD